MKKALTLLSVIVLQTMIFSPVSYAGTSGEIEFTSNYIWRGVSQTNGLPAIQGGFNFQPIDNLGLIFGVWGSSVHFDTKNRCSSITNATCNETETASLEIDAFAGLHFSLGDYEDLSLSVLLTKYSYPGALSLGEWTEASAAIVLGGLELNAGISDDYLGKGAASQYIEGKITIGFAILDVILGASYTSADKSIFANESDYVTFELSNSVSLGSVEVVSGVYISSIEDDTADGYCAFEVCGEQAFISLTKKF